MMQEKHLSHLLESGGREAGQAATPPPPRPAESQRWKVGPGEEEWEEQRV